MPGGAPTPQDISLPQIAGPRPVAGYDVSGYAQGAEALARSGQQLGAGIEKAGQEIAATDMYRARSQALLTDDQMLGDLIRYREQSRHDPSITPEQYAAGGNDIIEQHLQNIPNGPLRDRGRARAQITWAREQVNFGEQYFNQQKSDWRAGKLNELDELINTTGATDDPLHTQRTTNFGLSLNEGVAKGYISPVEKEQLSQKLARGVMDADFRAQFRAGHDSAVSAVQKLVHAQAGDVAAQTGDNYLATLFRLESGGNPNAVTGANRGLSQFGPAEEQRYGITPFNRTDPSVQVRAVRLEAEENRGPLQKATGRVTTDADLYLAHQQGQAGAIALFRNPGMPAWEAIRPYYRSDNEAKTAIGNFFNGARQRNQGNIPRDNPLYNTPVEQVTSQAFTSMWKDKWERAAGRAGVPAGGIEQSAYDILTPAHRDQLIAEGQRIIKGYEADDRADFTQRIQDTTAEAFSGKPVTNPIGEDEFIRRYDATEGPKHYAQYAANLQLGSDMQRLGAMSPDEVSALHEQYEPRSGEGFADAQKRQEAIDKAANQLMQERRKDPAASVIVRSPSVGEAWLKMQNAIQTKDADAPAAVRDYVTKTTQEQQRLGIAPSDVQVVPRGYIDNIVSQIEKPSQSGGADQVNARIKAQADMWGDAWPQIYKQMKGASPLVQVLGAGVKPAAAQLLTDNAKVKYGDIVKDEQSATSKDIQNGVNDALAPFARSLLGNAGGVGLYSSVRGETEKLAAVYAMQGGLSGADAAKKAAEDVINFKYEFRDGFRIPAKEHTRPVPYPADDMQFGAAIAKQHLGEKRDDVDLSVNPAIDTFGNAYTPDQLKQETANAKRTGQWTTNADESGLWLVHGGQIVRRPDGKPFEMTWDQLSKLGKTSAAPVRMGDAPGGGL